MDKERVRAVHTAMELCKSFNYNSEALISDYINLTGTYDETTICCAILFMCFHNTLSLFEYSEEQIEYVSNAWESCWVCGEEILATIISTTALVNWITSEVPLEALIEQKSLEELANTLERCPPEYVRFSVFLKNLPSDGFSEKAIDMALALWACCYNANVSPVVATEISLYWLNKQFNLPVEAAQI